MAKIKPVGKEKGSKAHQKAFNDEKEARKKDQQDKQCMIQDLRTARDIKYKHVGIIEDQERLFKTLQEKINNLTKQLEEKESDRVKSGKLAVEQFGKRGSHLHTNDGVVGELDCYKRSMDLPKGIRRIYLDSDNTIYKVKGVRGLTLTIATLEDRKRKSADWTEAHLA
ncbi:hypothetical protein R1sor_019268 [Riccia sorocarpa]|uniref:Uncharacterized protein n=1 Tax=Riccia sorocarpa TaxID=122646 RepID=A0ABD3IG72_9MARC